MALARNQIEAVLDRLPKQAADKLACIKELAPHMYLGTGDGIRSKLCSHASYVGQCTPCQLLQTHATKQYAARAKSKAVSTMLVTNALMKKDRPALEANAFATIAHQTLTGQQRAAVHVVQR